MRLAENEAKAATSRGTRKRWPSVLPWTRDSGLRWTHAEVFDNLHTGA